MNKSSEYSGEPDSSTTNNIVIAIDSFKGSLTSLQAGNSAAVGIKRVYPKAHITVLPLADGGEGTVNAMISGCGGKKISTIVSGPLGLPVSCEYGILNDKQTAVIEMSAAAGLTLIAEAQRDPMVTTTFGVGEIIRDAVKKGCRNFIVGIGGSATNDGGAGMLQALGFELLDKNGHDISYGAQGLRDLVSISNKKVIPELSQCSFRIACDVDNPLCGENGCRVFAVQKGAADEMLTQMDKWLDEFARIAKSLYPHADENYPGAGAAGGLGFAFMTFLNARLEPGVNIILDSINLREEIKNADILITGEGKLDSQTVMGKAPCGAAKIAKEYSKPVIALCGCVSPDAGVCNSAGIDAFFPVVRSAVSPDEAMNTCNAQRNVADTAEQVFRVIRCMNTK
ncbi:MAG: glycerate kinase [Oscillospiraceae bacterium]|nr:glycerate kinase [Oscillospiraceae bacterium]